MRSRARGRARQARRPASGWRRCDVRGACGRTHAAGSGGGVRSAAAELVGRRWTSSLPPVAFAFALPLWPAWPRSIRPGAGGRARAPAGGARTRQEMDGDFLAGLRRTPPVRPTAHGGSDRALLARLLPFSAFNSKGRSLSFLQKQSKEAAAQRRSAGGRRRRRLRHAHAGADAPGVWRHSACGGRGRGHLRGRPR